jgi:hypothetical protein
MADYLGGNEMKYFSVLLVLTVFFMAGCKNDSKKPTSDTDIINDLDDEEVIPDDETTDDADEELTDETPDETEDSDEPEMIQTGGIVIFNDYELSFDIPSSNHTILGQGGFFGYSIFRLNDGYWSVSAIHESIPPYDFEKATGVLYVFSANAKTVYLVDLDDMAHRLTHPDLSVSAGFGFSVAGVCDINNDGFDDLVVSSHLATIGDLYAAGEIVVFYGGETDSANPIPWNTESTSISRLSDTYIQRADAMSQSLVCGDIDGDGFADVMAGGQNAGPELTGGGSQGMVAFFKGGTDGLEENESWVLLPEIEEKAQYFGSNMILEDINGDGVKDLIVSGWGLKGSELAPNGGGVYIYHGGTDWQDGPSLTVFGPITSQFGSMIKLVKVEDETLLGVIAPKATPNGTIYFYDPETLAELFSVSVPSSLGMGDNGSFTDFDTFSDKDGKFTLVAGGKYFKDYGRVLCAQITPDNVEELIECLWQPETTTGGFGSSVKNVGKIDDESRENIVIGMPEYIHTVE